MSDKRKSRQDIPATRKRISEEREGRQDILATRKRMSEERDGRRRKRARTKEWECHNCDLSFHTQADLRRHEKNHTTTYQSTSNKIYIHTVESKKSTMTYNGSKRLRCNVCEITLSGKANFKQHCQTIHGFKDDCETLYGFDKNTYKCTVESKHGILTYNGTKKWRCPVCKSTLSNKANLKRHCETIHGFKDAPDKHNVNSQIVTFADNSDKERQKDFIEIMFVCDCTVATAKIDSAFEHAQLHHLEGYKPSPMTCATCKFTFEALHFADHLPDHSCNEVQSVNYSPSKLLHAEWCDMFPKVSEAHINRIKSRSIYEHTRKVKMNYDDDSGKPLYQCKRCDLFVSPKDVEDHCNKENDCLENQSIEHICCDCEIFFYTSEGLNEHAKEHKEGLGLDSFRIVTFNCKRDATINSALRQLKKNLNKEGDSRGDEFVCPDEVLVVEAVEIQQCNGKNKGIHILDDRIFCCGDFIPLSELKVHKETHRNNNAVELEIHQHKIDNVADEKNQRIENEVAQEQNIIMPDSKNHVTLEQSCEMPDKNGNISGDNPSQHAFGGCKRTDENTINQEINNSCGILPSKATLERVDNERVVKNATNADSIITTSPRVRKTIAIDDNFSEEMKNELRQELQKLITDNALSGHKEKDNVVRKKKLDQEHEEIKNSKLKNTQNTNKPKKLQDIKAILERLDVSNGKIQTLQNDTVNNIANSTEELHDSNDIIEILGDSDEENEIPAAKVEIQKEESVSNARPSSRDILSKMLPSNSCEADLTAAIEKATKARNRKELGLELQQIIEQTTQIRDIMFSRD